MSPSRSKFGLYFKRPGPEDPTKYARRPPRKPKTAKAIKEQEARGEKPTPQPSIPFRPGPREKPSDEALEDTSITLGEAVERGLITPEQAHRIRETHWTAAYQEWQRDPEAQAQYHKRREAYWTRAMYQSGQAYTLFPQQEPGRLDTSIDLQTLDEGGFPYVGYTDYGVGGLPQRQVIDTPPQVQAAFDPLIASNIRWENLLSGPSRVLTGKAEELRAFAEDPLAYQLGKGPRIDTGKDFQTLDVGDVSLSYYDPEEMRYPKMEGALATSGAVAMSAGAAIWDAATLRVRPLMWYQTFRGGVALAVHKPTQQAFLKELEQDPAGVLVTLPAGVLGWNIGGSLIRGLKARVYASPRMKRFRPIEYIPDEEFYVADELHLEYPEEVTYSRPRFRGFSEEVVDITSNQKFGVIDESGKWGELGEVKPYTPPKGKWPKGPWEAGGRAALFTPEGARTVYKPLIHLEGVTTWTPGLRTPDVTAELVSRTSRAGLPALLGGLNIRVPGARETQKDYVSPEFMDPIQFEEPRHMIKVKQPTLEDSLISIKQGSRMRDISDILFDPKTKPFGGLDPRTELRELPNIFQEFKETPKQFEATYSVQETDFPIPIFRQDPILEEPQKDDDPFPFPVPGIGRMDFDDPPRLRFRPRKQKRKRKKGDLFDIWGEYRRYPVKDPMRMVGD